MIVLQSELLNHGTTENYLNFHATKVF